MIPAAIVLAGGASSRFGGDKLAARYRELPVLHHALMAVGSVAGPIVLVLAPGAPVPPLPGALVPRVVVAHDPAEHEGPLAGLAAGLDLLAPGTESAIVVAGDMPSLVPSVLGLLADALAADAALGVVTLAAEPVAPLPAAVRPAIAEPAADALLADGRRSLRALSAAVPSRVLPADAWRALDPGGLTLRDIDTPNDLVER
jgi:molybdopterin-guanine dinucleotide biosynthesis protein A